MPVVVLRSRRALSQELVAFKEVLETYAGSPEQGAPFLSEQHAWKAAPQHTQRAHRRRLWQQAMLTSRGMVTNIIDHLWATSRLLDAPTIPLYAAGRPRPTDETVP